MTFHAREISSRTRSSRRSSTTSRSRSGTSHDPRGGLLRAREFIMKDAYSFDRDEEGLDASFDRHAEAYACMFERCGSNPSSVEAESGIMGGKESLGFLAPSRARARTADDVRERRLLSPTSRSRAGSAPPTLPELTGAPKKSPLPASRPSRLSPTSSASMLTPTSKAMPGRRRPAGALLGLVRGTTGSTRRS